MERSYKFAILQAAPDPRRGERVNIGVVVFHAEHIDVRFSELQKLRALTGRDWEQYVQSYRAHVQRVVKSFREDAERLAAISSFEKVIVPTDFGWLKSSSTEEYESRLREIIKSFVERAVAERKQSVTDRLWEISDIAALVDAAEDKPKKRGPYKKKSS